MGETLEPFSAATNTAARRTDYAFRSQLSLKTRFHCGMESNGGGVAETGISRQTD